MGAARLWVRVTVGMLESESRSSYGTSAAVDKHDCDLVSAGDRSPVSR